MAGKTIRLEGMGGNDTMKLTEVEALDSFFALMGENDDVLDMTFVKAKAMRRLRSSTRVFADGATTAPIASATISPSAPMATA